MTHVHLTALALTLGAMLSRSVTIASLFPFSSWHFTIEYEVPSRSSWKMHSMKKCMNFEKKSAPKINISFHTIFLNFLQYSHTRICFMGWQRVGLSWSVFAHDEKYILPLLSYIYWQFCSGFLNIYWFPLSLSPINKIKRFVEM